MPEAWSEGQFTLSAVEGGLGVAEVPVMQAGGVFVRRIAHDGVIAIEV
jgi:hypothetical protein